MLKYIWKNKIMLILILLALWLVPQTIGLSEQSQTESIVTAIGIDKNNNEYEVSLQYIIPNTSNGSEGLKIVSEKGESVGSAIEKIKLQLGKLSGFAHCKFLAFNDSACEENFTSLLDFFIRRKTNTNNIILINTPDSAKDLLSMSSKLDSELYSFLNNNYSNNELEDFHDLKTVGDYYGSYFSPVKCIFINSVSIKDNSSSSSGNESGSSESTSGSQSSSSNSNSQEPKELENKGKLLIIKNAKKLLTLNEEESDNLNLFNPKVKRDNFTVKNYSEGHLKNADILFNVLNKLYSTQAYFKDGKPYYKINLKLYVRTGEVISQNLTQKDYAVLQEDFSPKLISKMQEEVLKNLKSAENNFKENNYDVIDCYAWFLKTRNKELKAYLKTLKNPEEFIKNVNFEYNIQFVQSY